MSEQMKMQALLFKLHDSGFPAAEIERRVFSPYWNRKKPVGKPKVKRIWP